MIIKVKIEIPKGSYYKYEIDKTTGVLVLDRVLNQSIPYNYGYVLNSKVQDDGDALDCFVISSNPIESLSEVKAKIAYVVKGRDGGKQDDKLICILDGEKTLDPLHHERLSRYLTTYKNDFKLESFGTYEEAIAIYNASQN